LDDSHFFPGLRPLDGHNDVIDTEIRSMCLTENGYTLRVGAGQQHGPGVLAASRGAIAELPTDDTMAASFFDVFFEVELGGGVYVYNQTALRISSTIDCVPPQADYIHPTGCLPLYTSPIPGQGIRVANLTSAVHRVNPPPVEFPPTLTPWGVIALVVALGGVGVLLVLRRRVHARP
jgi:hypothetical protein